MTTTGYAIAAALVLLCTTLYFAAGYIIESAANKRLRKDNEIFRDMVINNREKDYSERRCGTCAHATRIRNLSGVLACTRNPPLYVEGETFAQFPRVSECERCGSYEKGAVKE